MRCSFGVEWRAWTSSSTRSALMAMAAAEPSPAAVMTWARGLTALPAAQTPGTLVRPVGSATTQPFSCVAQPRAGEQVAVRRRSRADEDRVAADDPAVLELDAAAAGRPRRPGGATGPSTMPMARAASCSRSSAVRLPVWVKNTTSSDHWRIRSACCTASGVPPSTPRRLVADLVAVAVGAVQQVAAPALAHAGEVGELVAEPGGDQHPPGDNGCTVGQRELEAALVAGG